MTHLLTFRRLKLASFTHSAIYTALLVVWLVPGLHALEAIFGMAHGLGWIAMSLACIAATRMRVIDLRLAVAVAVLGGIGPFVGSYEFARQSRRGRREAPAGAPAPTSA
ncbi:MAG: hypothetical protein QOJ35_1847 [Solirubrobacteraceae bacterium]|jgi:hypothetical protein|nr:hypothetical protein [Solirubrobacteraceae bacterium]